MSERLDKKQFALKLLGLIAVVAFMALSVWGLMRICGVDTIEGLRAVCNGFWGYIIIILLQIIQVVFIPISNQIITIPAIAVIGVWPAFFCSWIGIEIGSIILYLIGRFGGGKLLSWLLGDKEQAEKFENLIKTRRLFYPVGMVLFFIPDDILTTLTGVAKYNFWYVLVVSTITRGLCTLATVFGFGILTQSIVGIIILVVLILMLVAAGYIFLRYEPKIEEWFKNKFHK